MTDNSRINAYGGGFSQQHNSGSSRGSLTRFRRNRAVGDVVSGIFLRQENEAMGWVRLEGEELLALLPGNGPRPAPGGTVFFRIEQLEPDLVLRLLPPGEEKTVWALMPVSQRASLYTTTRDSLDALLAEQLWPNGPWATGQVSPAPPAFSGADSPDNGSGGSAGSGAAHQAYMRFIADNVEAATRYASLVVYTRALLESCGGNGLAAFSFTPWLCPGVKAVELAVFSTAEQTRLLVGARLGAGQMRIDALLGEKEWLFHVLLPDALCREGAASAPIWRCPEPGLFSGSGTRCVRVSPGRGTVNDVVAAILAESATTRHRGPRGRFALKV